MFLDEKGTKVLETRGFKSAREAKAMHEFVTKRLYRTTSLQEHLDRYPK